MMPPFGLPNSAADPRKTSANRPPAVGKASAAGRVGLNASLCGCGQCAKLDRQSGLQFARDEGVWGKPLDRNHSDTTSVAWRATRSEMLTATVPQCVDDREFRRSVARPADRQARLL